MLSGWEAATAELEHLRLAAHQLDELFKLVVVGEVNSGRAARMNALLGELNLPNGPMPTTDRTHNLAHTEAGVPELVQEGVRQTRYVAELLRQVRVAETPGLCAG